jgi:hypothetical protein
LIPAAIVPWFAGWWFSASVLGYIYRLMHPQASFVVLPDTLGGVLISVGLLFAWCPVAMMIGNLLAHAVPAARRALDQEASTVHGTDFRNANRGLMRACAVLFPLGVGAILVGLFL